MSSSACATSRRISSARSCPASPANKRLPPRPDCRHADRRAARPTSVAHTTAPARAPRGQNKAKILDALKGRGPMTASQIAEVTGIPAATVSSTLTKMAKTGELRKAERGYTLP